MDDRFRPGFRLAEIESSVLGTTSSGHTLAENEGTRDVWSHLHSSKENMCMEGDKMLIVLDICSLPLVVFSVLEHLTLQGEADDQGRQTPMPYDFSWKDNGGPEY